MNQIKSYLEKKGIEDIRPSDDTLKKMGIKIHSWNKWLDNKKDPEVWQLEIIAKFLECTISDLIHERHERASV